MKFTIGTGVEYEFTHFGELKLNELLLLESETKKLGRPVTLPKLETMQRELELTPQADRANHPDMGMYFAIQVWLSRRRAGDKLSLWDALDFRQTDLVLIAEESDLPPEPADPTKRPPGSGRAANPARNRSGASRSAKTSGKASASA